jgi:hypothetical protein
MARWRRCGGARGGREAEGRGERRRGEASGLAVGMRGEEVRVAVLAPCRPCCAKVVSWAKPAAHGPCRGLCRRPMSRLYTYKLQYLWVLFTTRNVVAARVGGAQGMPAAGLRLGLAREKGFPSNLLIALID